MVFRSSGCSTKYRERLHEGLTRFEFPKVVIRRAQHCVLVRSERQRRGDLRLVDDGADHVKKIDMQGVFAIERGQKFGHVGGRADVHERNHRAIAKIDTQPSVFHHLKGDGKNAGVLANAQEGDGVAANHIIGVGEARQQIAFCHVSDKPRQSARVDQRMMQKVLFFPNAAL